MSLQFLSAEQKSPLGPFPLPDERRESPGTPWRILVVEDDPALGRQLAWLLGDEGYDVTLVTTGHGAVAAVRSVEYDLMILDVKLPDISGVDVFRATRASTVGPRTIMLSGYLEEHDVRDVTAKGALYLAKPVDAQRLLLLIAGMKK